MKKIIASLVLALLCIAPATLSAAPKNQFKKNTTYITWGNTLVSGKYYVEEHYNDSVWRVEVIGLSASNCLPGEFVPGKMYILGELDASGDASRSAILVGYPK